MTVPALDSPIDFNARMSSSSSRSPDRTSVQQAAMKALQTKSVTITRLEGSVFRMFRLQSASDYFYILRCRPSSHVRMLRHEEERLQTEASTLSALHGRSDLLVPRLIEYTTTSTTIGCSYLISGPFRGAILSDIEPSLSPQALQHIDRSRGQYVQQLARVTGPSFGPVRQTASTTTPSPSWSRCFATLLEAVLRDAEDALVSIPYDFVRDQVRRHRATLDQITTPRLTLLEMYADKNAVVDSGKGTIEGVMDWGTAIWGDPFASDAFYQPAASFLAGFGRTPNRTGEERVRQYLYILYHSMLAVVRLCLRPNDGGDEMAARRDLTTALSQLRGIA